MTDREVLDRATAVIVTFDKDFGELAFHSRLPVRTGVILFRVQAPTSAQLAAFVTRVINSRHDWFGSFAVGRSLSGAI